MRHGDKPGRSFNQLVGVKPGLRAEYFEQASGGLDDIDDLLERAGPEPEEGDTRMHLKIPFRLPPREAKPGVKPTPWVSSFWVYLLGCVKPNPAL